MVLDLLVREPFAVDWEEIYERTSGHAVFGSRPGAVRQESALYKEFLAERAEILKHKWIERKPGKTSALKELCWIGL